MLNELGKIYEFIMDKKKVYSIKLYVFLIIILVACEKGQGNLNEDIIGLLKPSTIVWLAEILTIVLRLLIVYSKFLVGMIIVTWIITIIVNAIEKRWQIGYEESKDVDNFLHEVCLGSGYTLMDMSSNIVLNAILLCWCGGEIEFIFRFEGSILDVIFWSIFVLAFMSECFAMGKRLLLKFFANKE